MSNPRKKSRRKNPTIKKTARKGGRRSNPVVSKRRKGGARRRNPEFLGYKPLQLVKLGVGAAAGALGSRAIPQLVLKDKNTGLMGYVANATTAILLGMLAGKWDKEVAVGAMAGGFGSLFQRVWNERVSMTSAAAAVSGLGDLDYSTDGMGEFVQATWPQAAIGGPYAPQALPAANTTAGASLPAHLKPSFAA